MTPTSQQPAGDGAVDCEPRAARWWPLLLLALGTAVTVAALAGGNRPAAVVAAVGFAGWAALARLVPDRDVVHDLLLPAADERDRRVQATASSAAAAALAPVLAVGAVLELAHGHAGPFTALAALHGAVSLGAQAWVRRRM
ncbi:hypothetical protein CLV35_0447 [Motilibacter peucedani]|uniref:Uncharacterized protein n=1 Tax=Motilibacter peucedani TaxID=598650 RepID=A0A420XT77_9ACTN|nr:hypothetical protein [Motilibacter peucedani]RKS80028.1 hypothetical protein CLV35_0447 [Motilibacter peucedani]